MPTLCVICAATILGTTFVPALSADDILDAIDQARKTYKFVIHVQGSADGPSKLAYANAVDVAALSKM